MNKQEKEALKKHLEQEMIGHPNTSMSSVEKYFYKKYFKKSTSENPAFQEGKLAFSNGIKLSENPYTSSNKELALAWETGWKKVFELRKTFVNKSIKQNAHPFLKRDGASISDFIFRVTSPVEAFFEALGTSLASILTGIILLLFYIAIAVGILGGLWVIIKGVIGFLKYYGQFA
jgi:hypothetical protein